jgi:hypothetical protein
VRVLTSSDAEKELARALGKWVVVASGFDLPTEVYGSPPRVSCAPYLSPISPTVLDGRAIVICETEAEGWEIYDLTHGDDGITVRGKDARTRIGAPLDVRDRVYCCIINPQGEVVTENT